MGGGGVLAIRQLLALAIITGFLTHRKHVTRVLIRSDGSVVNWHVRELASECHLLLLFLLAFCVTLVVASWCF